MNKSNERDSQINQPVLIIVEEDGELVGTVAEEEEFVICLSILRNPARL